MRIVRARGVECAFPRPPAASQDVPRKTRIKPYGLRRKTGGDKVSVGNGASAAAAALLQPSSAESRMKLISSSDVTAVAVGQYRNPACNNTVPIRNNTYTYNNIV
jgi:hypothetical protein